MPADPAVQSSGFRISLAREPALLGGILILTALVYAATLRFAFVLDGDAHIAQNALIQSWRFLPRYFGAHAWRYLFPDAAANDYRPLAIVWFRVSYALFGAHAAGWHAAAVLLHVFATALAYRLARALTGEPLVAAVAALVFGIHPMRHEVVAWVPGSAELLCAVFFFLSFLAYLRSREAHRLGWVGVSCVMYAGALLSSETAVVLPLLVFTHAYLYGASPDFDPAAMPRPAFRQTFRKLRSAARVALFYVTIAVAYLAARAAVLGGNLPSATHMSLRVMMLTLPSAILFYCKQWLLPFQSSEYYDLALQSSFSLTHVLLPLVALALAAAVLWLCRSKLGERGLAFSASWIVISLVPVLNLRRLPPGELLHDRFFYLPSFGACLILGVAVVNLADGPCVFGLPRRWAFATLAIMAALSYATASAVRYWESDYSVLEHASRVAPLNATAQTKYAVELSARGDYGRAMPLLQSVLDRDSADWRANYESGRLFYRIGMMDPAKLHLERAAALNADRPETFLQLALIDLKSGEAPAAETRLRRAVALQPFAASFRFALAAVLARQGKCTEAGTEFSELLTLQPTFAQAKEQMNNCQPGGPIAASEQNGTAAFPPSPAAGIQPGNAVAHAPEAAKPR